MSSSNALLQLEFETQFPHYKNLTQHSPLLLTPYSKRADESSTYRRRVSVKQLSILGSFGTCGLGEINYCLRTGKDQNKRWLWQQLKKPQYGKQLNKRRKRQFGRNESRSRLVVPIHWRLSALQMQREMLAPVVEDLAASLKTKTTRSSIKIHQTAAMSALRQLQKLLRLKMA